MGSTSSKDHDAHPCELGTNSSAMPSTQLPHYSGKHPTQHPAPTPSSLPPNSALTTPSDSAAPNATNSSQSHATIKSTSSYPVHVKSLSKDAMEVDSVEHFITPTNTLESTSSSVSTSNFVPEEDVVPMVFRWEHGGRNVCITGTFNNWSKQMPMHRSGNDFVYITNLSRGKHAYKFVVDDEWRSAPDQLTVADLDGNVNNYVDVSDFIPLSDIEALEKAHGEDSDKEEKCMEQDTRGIQREEVYGRYIPDVDEYTKEPPPLPPHLRHIILNKVCFLLVKVTITF